MQFQLPSSETDIGGSKRGSGRASSQENLSLKVYKQESRRPVCAFLSSLTSAFVICLFESIVSRLTTSEISNFMQVYVAEQADLNLTFSEPPTRDYMT